MNKIQELEAQLAEEKQKKVDKGIELDLSRMRKNMVGKFYSTHLLNRYMGAKKAFTFSVLHVKDAKYDKDRYNKYFYVADRLEVSKDGDSFEVTKKEFMFGTNWGHGCFRHFITEKQFKHVWNTFPATFEVAIDKLRFAFKADDYVSQGDFSDDRSRGDLMKNQGFKILELSDREAELLRWDYHPYLFGLILYKAPKWLEIIIDIRDTMEEKSRSWGGSIWERDAPRNRTLTTLINNNL